MEIVEILVDAGANTQLCAASCSAQKQARLVEFLLMTVCARIPGTTDYTCRQNQDAGQESLYPRDIL